MKPMSESNHSSHHMIAYHCPSVLVSLGPSLLCSTKCDSDYSNWFHVSESSQEVQFVCRINAICKMELIIQLE